MPALKPKARSDLSVAEIEGEAVIYDPEAIRLHHLNQSAAVVFQLCDGSGTVRELAEDLADALGLPQEQVLPQVRTVVSNFKQSGLLVGKRGTAPPPTHTHQHRHG